MLRASSCFYTHRGELIASVFVLVLLAIPAWLLSPPGLLLDLPEYYTAARMLLQGHGADIYQIDIFMAAERILFPGGQTVVLYVPPWALPWILPVGLIPLTLIRPMWWTVLLLCIALCLFILGRAFNLGRRDWLRLCAFTCTFGAEWEIIKHGQIAPFLVLAIAVACYELRRGSQGWAGVSLAVLSLKPQFLMPLAAFLLGSRRYKTVLYMVSTISIISLLSWFLVGARGYDNYRLLLSYSMLNRVWMAPECGPNLRGQLLRLFPTCDVVVLIVSSIVLVCALTALFLVGSYFRRSRQWMELWMILACPIGILTSLHCHNYDLLLLLPTVAALVSMRFFTSSSFLARAIVLLCGLIFLIPVYAKIHYDLLLHGLVWNPFFLVLVLFSAIMVYAARKAGK